MSYTIIEACPLLGFTKINKEGKVDTSYLRGAKKSAEARRK